MARNKPFGAMLHDATELAHKGALVYQTWTCRACQTKQTIEQANAFYTHGKCERCGAITDMLSTGCGMDLILSATDPKPKEITVYDSRNSEDVKSQTPRTSNPDRNK
jgi:hypothetical protein